MDAAAITALTTQLYPEIFEKYWDIRENGLHPAGLRNVYCKLMKRFFYVKEAVLEKNAVFKQQLEDLNIATREAQKVWNEKFPNLDPENENWDTIMDEMMAIGRDHQKVKKLIVRQEKYFKESSVMMQKWNEDPVRIALSKFGNLGLTRQNIGTHYHSRWIYFLQ